MHLKGAALWPFPSGACAVGAVLATMAAGIFATPTMADVLHLKNGGSVEGTITEKTASSYTVRTIVGTVTLPAEAVERVEEKPSILDEYLERREQASDTPEAQVALAQWCDEQGLKGACRQHFKRAVELDPDCEPARRALGFVRVGGMWVDGRRVSDRAGKEKEEEERKPPNTEDDETVVAAIQSQWALQVRAIANNNLESSVPRLVQAGRERIRDIRDPLAILPMVRVLSTGNRECRDALVESLSGFPQDEATMNLAALALLDEDDGVRGRALAELKRRAHPQVVPQFRRALVSDNDALIRRAAIGLGALEDKAAVPELIDVLTARRRKLVEVSVRTYFSEYPTVFHEPTIASLGGVTWLRHYPAMGIESIGLGFVFVDRDFQMRNVTVYRTEVREALRKITGEDFGFDRAAWRRWYEEQQS
jgi:hypothetical protein